MQQKTPQTRLKSRIGRNNQSGNGDREESWHVIFRFFNIDRDYYENPLHLDVVDRYLRRMGDKTIPDEAPPSLEPFYPYHES